ncbi:LuxR C-terminal-related transcriptional regulator [Actinosynnema sp. NPDC047251]|uniref:Transcriptional regulator, LuxR family n=1 Tax=Saccharothrix espanaensis (strain ATCC 51144 / DSM 44229 / JCM 9112 / NBRC 15066 / NRRL 15764) TaxID=1179773 RepID=K0JX42_SACES|nr:LuxR C-terminal-related transcriptional regulator [Saccharothrix espanaensis]CCH32455.1 Transcriptional regulator, LuxR family [Saccharothrix espanaensis DSM 44229]
MEKRVRVVVQSSDHLSQAGLTSFLGARPEVALVDADRWADAEVAVVAVGRLTDEVVAGLRRSAKGARVPVVLVLDEIGEADVLTAVECRVVAFLPRAGATGDRVLRSVLAAAAGGGAMPPAMVAELLDHVRRLQRQLVAPSSERGRLTGREVEVLRLMADGLDTAEIATTLSYSERTIKNVFYGITSRLNLRNRPHAVAYALRKGMI